jgi:hypothetical protein
MATNTDRMASHRSSATAWIGVLSVLVVGLAGWLAFELFWSNDAAPVAEVSALVDSFTEALNDRDVAGLEATVTPEFATNVPGSSTTDLEAVTAWVDGLDLTIEPIGPMIATVDGLWTTVVVPQVAIRDQESADPGARVEAMGTFVVYGNAENGYLISRYWVESPANVTPRN